jgi:hypothetical protein
MGLFKNPAERLRTGLPIIFFFMVFALHTRFLPVKAAENAFYKKRC